MKQIVFFTAVYCFCLPPAVGDEPAAPDPKDKLIVETVLRLKDFDLNSSAKAKEAVLRYLKSQPGTDKYFDLIERFKPVEIADSLATYCLENATSSGGVRGAELLFAMGAEAPLLSAVKAEETTKAVAATTLVGYAAGKETVRILGPLLDSKLPVAVRNAAVTGLGRSRTGQETLLSAVVDGKLPNDLKFSVANVLLSSDHDDVKSRAAKYLTLPATADSEPLPTIAELVGMKGDASAGAVVFRKPGTCINCHKVQGEGKSVGPDLSEIGSKLSRQALYVSILDPSAAISHNYESYIVVTEQGLTFSGLLISETDDAVTLRNREGIDKTFQKAMLEEFEKQKQSLMPRDLQKLMTVQQLVDVVEFATTLRKQSEPLPGAP